MPVALSQYHNLFDHCDFEAEKPVINQLLEIGSTQVKRVTLKVGTELKCHQTSDHVLIVWLRGKASFTANDEVYVMHPGSLLEMPSGTPHGATAETDCVFIVLKFKE